MTRRWLGVPWAMATSASALMAQGKPEQAGFIVRLGRDTLAVEQIARSDRRLESEMALRVPTARQVHYVAELDSLGRIARLDVTMRPLGSDGSGPTLGSIAFGADSADVTLTRGDSSQRLRLFALVLYYHKAENSSSTLEPSPVLLGRDQEPGHLLLESGYDVPPLT
jgi:hypothetical protein